MGKLAKKMQQQAQDLNKNQSKKTPNQNLRKMESILIMKKWIVVST